MTQPFHPLTVFRRYHDTPDSSIISFLVPESLRPLFKFVQGQYLTLRHRINGEDILRAYSICSGVDDRDLRIGVRKIPNSAFSTWLHDDLSEGDVIDVMTPQGGLFIELNASTRRHHVGIAVGSGITPILSILRTVLTREPQSHFTLVYGNRSRASVMFMQELVHLKDCHLSRLAVHHVFSREASDLAPRPGRLEPERVAWLFDRLVPLERCDHVFVCGPQAVKDAVEMHLRRHDFPTERIHFEC